MNRCLTKASRERRTVGEMTSIWGTCIEIGPLFSPFGCIQKYANVIWWPGRSLWPKDGPWRPYSVMWSPNSRESYASSATPACPIEDSEGVKCLYNHRRTVERGDAWDYVRGEVAFLAISGIVTGDSNTGWCRGALLEGGERSTLTRGTVPTARCFD